MAGDWIPRQNGLSRKQEVLDIAKATGRDRRWVADALCEFWEWCDQELAAGLAKGRTIADLCGLVPGTDETFWLAVQSAGWLRVTAIGLSIPHFDRWLGRSAKKRLENTRRQHLSRIARDKSATTVLSCSVLSAPENELVRSECTPPTFELSAAGLGQQWCFYLTRKRLGVVRDSPLDMAAEFAELIRLGHAPQKLQAAIAEKCRDRGEHFWQFKERIVGKASKPSAPRPKATFDPETVKPQPPEDQEKSRKIMAEARAKIGRMPQ